VKPFILAILLLCTCWVPTRAQENFVKIDLRVISSKPVVVDRGSGDGLAVGDVVRFFSRQGNTYRGNVEDLDERSAVVKLLDPTYVPEPGTRAEARIPRSRLGPAEEEEEDPEGGMLPPDPPADGAGEEIIQEEQGQGEEREEQGDWENEDEDWRPGMPLLAEVETIRPEDRAMRVTGRYYMRGHSTFGSESGRSDSFTSTGVDVRYENPWGRGGTFKFATDLSYRNVNVPDENNDNDLTLRFDRVSYALGGTRFAPTRWEVGRFLQHGMPEFGYLDGVEWSRRRENGDRFGASLGGMPERDYEFSTGGDLQMAAYYEWVQGDREELSFAAGFQKTLHHKDSDRDLLVTRFRYLPLDAWNYNATAWIDFYTGSDDYKDNDFELTQAIVSANRSWRNGNGLSLTYNRIRFPDIDRNNEFVPPTTRQEIENNRNDRLSLSGWTWSGEDLRLFGHAAGWDDQDDSGGDTEVGFEVRDAFARNTDLTLAAFGAAGKFEDVVGGRVSLAKTIESGRWDLYYEFANHRQSGFSSDFNDIGQHRLRGSRDWYTPGGWTISVYGEGAYWDEEGSWSLGFYLQKIF
jgi:hypothetical protein